MLKIRRIMIENNISIEKLALTIGKTTVNLSYKLLKKTDFSIEELNKIKQYFVKKGIVNNDFEIGEFLKEI